MLMQVLKAPNSQLRADTKPVKKINPALLQTLKEMVKLTKTFKDPEGVGLASTQVGLNERFFVAKKGDESGFNLIINPEITWVSKRTKKHFEGCLSIPKYWGEVERFLMVKVKYMDENGKIIEKTLKGLDAHIFQHEVDHLNGTLFVDRVMEQNGKLYKAVGKDKTGTDIFEEIEI